MKTLTGLLKKDILISEKIIKLTAAAGIMMLIMTFVLRFAYVYGKLQGQNSDFADLMAPLYLMLFCALPVTFCNTSINEDRKSHWNQFAASAGISPGTVAGSKAAETVIAALITGVTGTAANLVYAHFFSGVCTSAGIIIAYVVFIFFISFEALTCSLAFVFKKTVLQAILLVCGGCAGMLLSGKVTAVFKTLEYNPDNPSDDSLKLLASGKIIGNKTEILTKAGVTGAAVIIFSFILMYFTVKRRYRKCGG